MLIPSRLLASPRAFHGVGSDDMRRYMRDVGLSWAAADSMWASRDKVRVHHRRVLAEYDNLLFLRARPCTTGPYVQVPSQAMLTCRCLCLANSGLAHIKGHAELHTIACAPIYANHLGAQTAPLRRAFPSMFKTTRPLSRNSDSTWTYMRPVSK